ncbi:MAG TPA: GNAT family N-acetyltransferase [Desulfomonilaceae bacterium]|nr:GNAT family N-acetyltransferase [Desulfomonilaceae bacterium]
MNDWKARYASKLVSAEEAASYVNNGARIYLSSMCCEPTPIIEALRASTLEDVEMIQFISGNAARSLAAKGHRRFRLKTFFLGGLGGHSGGPSEADYVPLFHSQIPDFFRDRRIPIDLAIVQVSEPDRFGRFSLGISVDVSLSAVESARMVIAQVNPLMPRTHGDTLIPGDKIHCLVDGPQQLVQLPAEMLGDQERAISRYSSELVDDGSVLEVGFAGISAGLADNVKDRRHLGIHTEFFADPYIDLIEAGVIDNSTKKIYRGKSLATCCMGTQRAYDFINENPSVEFYPSDVLLHPAFIADNDKMVAINLAVQVDLRGQVRQGKPHWTAFEGSGGDHDFMRGASLSSGGRSIICLRSTSLQSGRSTIVPSFGPRAAVIMNRGEVNYIVTEYGIAYLGGKSLRERAMALIEIAHPDHREDLMKAARELGYVYPDQHYVCTAKPKSLERVRTDHVFKGGLKAHIRVIQPTDESMIRDLFYALSKSSVYFRYFSPRTSMPHDNLREYVSLSEDKGLSLVVTTGPYERSRIIAEARYAREDPNEFPQIAFMVDEKFQGRGIATFLVNYLMEIAKERGIEGLQADVLLTNEAMLHVMGKTPYTMHKTVSDGMVSLKFRFDEPKNDPKGASPEVS